MENEKQINEIVQINEKMQTNEIVQINEINEEEQTKETQHVNNRKQTLKGEQNTRVHRIGTITFGLSLLAMGILFLLHMFLPMITYQTVYRLWPVIFIMLGLEILILNYKEKKNTLVYDKAGVFLMFCMMTFAMFMGIMEQIIQHIQVFS